MASVGGTTLGWMVECLPSMYEALGQIPSMTCTGHGGTWIVVPALER